MQRIAASERFALKVPVRPSREPREALVWPGRSVNHGEFIGPATLDGPRAD
ncbi:hypothetical protein [Variovorax saccharolyticus]|uniref:hypothetical protein n=1 Tax=Variovorax saccharolyticus TaxID=3053516 RepID=UPI0025773C40|nr:hypothetical protein [Variovorax sp. J31P216]MDM0030402.1 hypothetical protein [Variovorax sp. J31P216]